MNSRKANPMILAEAESDNAGCGKEFEKSICLLKHFHQKKLEEQGKRNAYEPCAYCPKILNYLAKDKGETETMPKTAPKPEIKKPRPGSRSECLECKKIKLIAAGGLCHKCYRTPEIKQKYKFQDRSWLKKIKSDSDAEKAPKTSPEPASAENANSGQSVNFNIGEAFPECDVCSARLPVHQMVLAGERLICNDCIDAANPQETPEATFPCARCDKRATKKQMDKTFLCLDCQNERLTPPIELPSPQITPKSKHVSIPGIGENCPEPVITTMQKLNSHTIVTPVKLVGMEPLEELLVDRRRDLEELRRQAAQQTRLLEMKHFEIRTIDKLCEDLQSTIEKMKA